jgi:hypothetical protein
MQKMRLNFKYGGLVLGIASVIVSFIFFGRRHGIYQFMLVGGFIATVVFYLTILFGKESRRTKLISTVIVIIGGIIQYLTEPVLIDSSYFIYVSRNEKILNEINTILDNTKGDVTVFRDTIIYNDEHFLDSDRNKLIEGKKKLGVYIIEKTDHKFYYGLWGFLDVRLGITYWGEKDYPDIRYQHIKGNWFH